MWSTHKAFGICGPNATTCLKKKIKNKQTYSWLSYMRQSVHRQHPVRLERVAPSGVCHPEACIVLTGHSVLMKVVLVGVRREKELYGNIWSIDVRVRKTEKRGEEGGKTGGFI